MRHTVLSKTEMEFLLEVLEDTLVELEEEEISDLVSPRLIEKVEQAKEILGGVDD